MLEENTMQYRYTALRIKQTDESPWIVLTGAPAREIIEWGGIPQKRKLDGTETTGFQREFNNKRLDELIQFFNNKKNVSQNSILCASRNVINGNVEFETTSDDGYMQTGYLKITDENYEDKKLEELFKYVVEQLEERVPKFKYAKISEEKINHFKERANFDYTDLEFEEKDYNNDYDIDDNNSEEEIDDDDRITNYGKALEFEEAHLFDFWEDLKGKYTLLKELGNFDGDEFLGYSREVLISYLKPIVVVDGQHRLVGAVASIDHDLNKESYKEQMANLVDQGMDESEVLRSVEINASRILPISLILESDPAEHLFQFVIVNQKAVGMSPPLLGTIASTSLSDEELNRVKDRLNNSGIPLEDSRAVSILINRDDSPFKDKVQKGLEGDNKDLLSWSVFKNIVKIFKELKGGKLYHEPKIDYAKLWKEKYLHESMIISDWSEKEYENPYQFWSSLDGPWMDVFIIFWHEIKRKFASDDPVERNYWGNPKYSNLYNKPSLTILASDFFCFLHDKELTINNPNHVKELVNRWLENIADNYFAREWDLKHVKKELSGIMKNWSSLWVPYRKGATSKPKSNVFKNVK